MNIVSYLVSPGIRTLTMTDRDASYMESLLDVDAHVVNCHDEPEFLASLPGADIVLTWVFRQEWFSLAPRLRLVSTPAAGKDYFSVQWPEGVDHWNGEFHGEFMAETAVGMILGMARGILPAVTTYADNPWPRHEIDSIAQPLRESTVTICGFGKIGRECGRLLKAFDAKIQGVSRQLHEAPDYFTSEDGCHTAEEIDRLLPITDHLLLVLPRTQETDRFLDARRIGLLPEHATVTNIGRGNAIDEDALVKALESGRLAGAALDVTATEPLPGSSPMRRCRNLWITPHSSAFNEHYMERYAEEFASRLNEKMS